MFGFIIVLMYFEIPFAFIDQRDKPTSRKKHNTIAAIILSLQFKKTKCILVQSTI